MPNYVYAGFNVTGDLTELKRFVELIFRPVTDADCALPHTALMFDFNGIIPMPADMAETNCYDWALDHWGVVWSAIDLNYRFDETNVWFHFTTAWDFPTPVFEALATEFPMLVFAGSAYEESHEFELVGAFNGDDDWGPGKINWVVNTALGIGDDAD